MDLVPVEDVMEGEDPAGLIIALIHENSVKLRRMAAFDVVINNADRKGDHVLPMPGGHPYGVGHGLTFSTEHELRTVLWGQIGEVLSTEELAGIDRVLAVLNAELGARPPELLTDEENKARLGCSLARGRSVG